MANPRGAPLPADLNPADDICMIVHIPNEPAYIAAFNGLYRRLGYWWAWARDDLHLGRFAAARWRQAVNASEEDWEKWGDICTMDITVNVNQCCDPLDLTITIINEIHVNQEVINQIINLPGGQVDNGTDPPSADWPDYGAYQIEKCTAANQIVDDFLLTLENFSDFGLFVSGIAIPAIYAYLTTASIGALIAGTLAAPISAAGAMLAILGVLAGLAILGPITFSYFDKIRAEIDRQALLCAVYGATDADAAVEAMIAEIDNWLAAALIQQELLGPQFIAAWDQLARLLIAPELLELAFDKTDYVAGLIPGNCVGCAGVPPGGGSGMLDVLIHAWEMEEASGSRVDQIGTKNLTPINSPTQVAGAVGNGVNLTRSTLDQLQNTTAWASELGDSDWTFAVWARPVTLSTGDATTWRTVLVKGNQNGTDVEAMILCESIGGEPFWTFRIGAGTISTFNYAIHPATITVGEWVMIVVWHDAVANTANIQVNNGTIQTLAMTGTYPNTLGFGFFVGVSPGQNRYWDGDIDQLFVWNRTLSPLERTWLWNNGQGRALSDF